MIGSGWRQQLKAVVELVAWLVAIGAALGIIGAVARLFWR
jgi:hypothetical protein